MFLVDFSLQNITSSHEWFMRMRAFNQTLSRIIHRKPEAIRVAVIDDGVDDSVPIIKQKLKMGISYYPYGNYFEARADRYGNYSHGTLMAALICAVCPEVDLYVARLNVAQEEIDTESAIDVRFLYLLFFFFFDF